MMWISPGIYRILDENIRGLDHFEIQCTLDIVYFGYSGQSDIVDGWVEQNRFPLVGRHFRYSAHFRSWPRYK